MNSKETAKNYASQGYSSYDKLPVMHQKQILLDYFEDLTFEMFSDLISKSHEIVRDAFRAAILDHPRLLSSLAKSVARNYLVVLINKDLECSSFSMKDNKEKEDEQVN